MASIGSHCLFLPTKQAGKGVLAGVGSAAAKRFVREGATVRAPPLRVSALQYVAGKPDLVASCI